MPLCPFTMVHVLTNVCIFVHLVAAIKQMLLQYSCMPTFCSVIRCGITKNFVAVRFNRYIIRESITAIKQSA